jgi:hypothetical protein
MAAQHADPDAFTPAPVDPDAPPATDDEAFDAVVAVFPDAEAESVQPNS